MRMPPRSGSGQRRDRDPIHAANDPMSPGPTFDRVYPALKEQLMSGRFAPGDHLEPAAIGQELNSSITPVRDALHRLVGEKLVEVPRNDGFRVPSPTEAELRDLYRWNGVLLEQALRQRPSATAAAVPHRGEEQDVAPGSAARSAAELFRHMARRSGNAELEAAVENVSDRLAALRVVEARVFADLAEELAGLCALLADANTGPLRRAIAAYHRRRQRCVPDLLVAARRLHASP
jgi:DNA-binding GntR family transcriptional regulator